MKEINTDFDIPTKFKPILKTDKKYIILRGGRGSGKSWQAADYTIINSLKEKKRILCGREIQNSIKQSVHKLICDRIETHKLNDLFKITDNSIKVYNGSEYIFIGFHRNIDSVKSCEGVDIFWGEEAQSFSQNSLDVLIPTIRKPDSKLIFTYNPTNEDDPIHKKFTLTDRNDTLNILANYSDNPFFPDVLRAELEYDKQYDYDKYLHIWEGQCVAHSEDQVFYGKWEISDFEAPEDVTFYHGLDFGYSNDPTAAVRCFVKDDCLYIDKESFKIKLEITDTAKYITNDIPTISKHHIIADSARPETISHLRNINGMNISGAKKGAGSVIDGIQKIRGFKKIFIHESCKETITEFRLYKWKRNTQTAVLLNDPEDKHNHIIDALRYSLEKYNKSNWTVHQW